MKAGSDVTDPCIFKVADLTMLYKERLKQPSVDLPKVHATRLKEQLHARTHSQTASLSPREGYHPDV